MSLGIDDPVTKSAFGSDDKYHRELARELARALEKPLRERGGIMALSDVYCRINRARGLEVRTYCYTADDNSLFMNFVFKLMSPEDLLNACRVLNSLSLSVR